MDNYLRIQPDTELVFHVSGTQTQATFAVTNGHADAHIAFKIKTTAPRMYHVRPSAGQLAPGASCEIVVLFQLKEGTAVDYRRTDKFQIQSIKMPPAALTLEGEALANRISELWTHAEQISKTVADSGEIIAQRKLRCTLVSLIPTTGTREQLSLSQSASEIDLTTSGPTDISEAASMLRQELTAPQATKLNETKSLEPFSESEGILTTRESTGAKNASVMERELSVAVEKVKVLQAACDAYKAEIDRITHLRQRRNEGSPLITKTIHKEKAAGISMPIALIFALLAFVIGKWVL